MHFLQECCVGNKWQTTQALRVASVPRAVAPARLCNPVLAPEERFWRPFLFLTKMKKIIRGGKDKLFSNYWLYVSLKWFGSADCENLCIICLSLCTQTAGRVLFEAHIKFEVLMKKCPFCPIITWRYKIDRIYGASTKIIYKK